VVALVAHAKRRELGDFLRSRRARIGPEEIGIEPGARRRTEGLRREEVAGLAGVSTSWYTYLEQGRDVRPSDQVLDAVGRVLRLDADEMRFLRRLSADPAFESLPGELAPREIVTTLVRLDDDSPYPTYAFDGYCDLVAWNPATTTYYTDFGRLPPPRRNMMWWLLASEEARRRLPDWQSDVADIVARWRRMAVAVDPPRLQRQVVAFKRLSPEFARWWDSHDVREHHTRLRRFDHPELGLVTLRLIVAESPEFSGHRVGYHAPVVDPAD
jgi:transcriptional regulator with XRE-family HTH domain